MDNFDEIRPYHDDEVKGVVTRLLANEDFLEFLGRYYSPWLSKYFPVVARFAAHRVLNKQLGKVTTIYEFQQVVAAFGTRIIAETMTWFKFEGIDKLEENLGYLFIGNHRDIAGDSFLVNYALWSSDLPTVRIAVGDNLVQKDFATAIMKLNKSFFIKRSEEGAKKVFAALMESSRYIHQSIDDTQSVWIAQSEGRAKDGMDVTDPAIIKMFALATRKRPLTETIEKLHVMPVSIAYEYDPCDYLKAKELYIIQTEGEYEKPSGEDLLSLVKGLGEFKGRVILRFGERLAGTFETAEEIAGAVDRQVLDNYQLFFVNYWALRELASTEDADDRVVTTWEALKDSVEFTETEEFEARYLACPEAWRVNWLEMYANPVVNKYLSKSSRLAPV
ncbi:MAG: 1-acyl-sn-glycerol-3-phosphate acyltransferase [bacterium]|nr:glycerol acyltransferase [Gammaproteobacteria bacterium]HIL94698.1 glycerol acyltransferase [Pseudomonadales bacterium]